MIKSLALLVSAVTASNHKDLHHHPEYEEHMQYVRENHGVYENKYEPIDEITHEIEFDFYIPKSRIHHVHGNTIRFGLFGKRVPKTVERFVKFVNNYNAEMSVFN